MHYRGSSLSNLNFILYIYRAYYSTYERSAARHGSACVLGCDCYGTTHRGRFHALQDRDRRERTAAPDTHPRHDRILPSDDALRQRRHATCGVCAVVCRLLAARCRTVRAADGLRRCRDRISRRQAPRRASRRPHVAGRHPLRKNVRRRRGRHGGVFGRRRRTLRRAAHNTRSLGSRLSGRHPLLRRIRSAPRMDSYRIRRLARRTRHLR